MAYIRGFAVCGKTCFDITDPPSTKMATISPTNGTRSHKHITSIMVVIMGVISDQQDAIFLQRQWNTMQCFMVVRHCCVIWTNCGQLSSITLMTPEHRHIVLLALCAGNPVIKHCYCCVLWPNCGQLSTITLMTPGHGHNVLLALCAGNPVIRHCYCCMPLPVCGQFSPITTLSGMKS